MTYITTKTLFTINWVELINKKEFAKATLNTNFKTFVIYISTWKILVEILVNL